MDTLMKDSDVCWFRERLAEAQKYLIEIEAQDYHGVSEEQRECIAAEHSMCSVSIWVLEEMIESLQNETD